MPVSADATAVKNRIRKLRTQLFSAAEEGTRETAQKTIRRISDNAIIRTGHERQRQVGFDMAQFLDNLEGLTRLAPGRYAILDTEKMGTAEDFEKIFRVKDLWHYGTGKGEKFEKYVLDIPGWKFLVGEARKAIWGPKTPQWYILENGSSTGDGEPVPPSNFIRSVVADESSIYLQWREDILAAMRRRGI